MYTARAVTTVLGLSPARLRSYLKAGFVAPARGDDGQLQFSFQDLVLLRKAEGLVTQRIAPRRVHSALRKMREQMPDDVPLSQVQFTAEGRDVVVSDGATRWHPVSGQVLFDFEIPAAADAPTAALHELPRRPPPVDAAAAPLPKLTAQEYYERGCALEEGAPGEAQRMYRATLETDPAHADAQVNLGRLLHESGDPHAALAHYRAALTVRPRDGTAAFNLGVALEDLGRTGEAIEFYQRAIGIDANNADAHYNLARLFERSGKPESAVRHLMVYRQLTKKR